MQQIWTCAAGLCAATLVGSIVGFVIKRLPHRWHDAVLGFCAGVMLAAAVLGLILPAAAEAGLSGWWMVAVGIFGGAAFLNLLDFVTPHLHHITGLEPEAHHNNAALGRVLLFVMAIAIHKLPEGVAAGISFLTDDPGDAWTVTLGVALQNIPEGMVIISPLLLAGVSRGRTLAIALAIGALEIVGVWIGYAAGRLSTVFLPAMLAFAGGAMLYVVSDEMIPETHAHGYQKSATYALLAGFMLLLFVDQAFGG